MRPIVLLPIALTLTACGKAYVKPEVVAVDRPAFVRIPANLTDCTYIAPAIVTNGDLARAYQTVSAALQACALDAEAVRRLQEGVK